MGNKIFNLFNDINNKFSIDIDDFNRFKMMSDIRNLIKREIFNLDELETYVIRCKYGLYDRSVGSEFIDIGRILKISDSRVEVIYNKAIKKIVNYIYCINKLCYYGDNSIYSLYKIDLDILINLEKLNIIYVDDLNKLDDYELFSLLKSFKISMLYSFDEKIIDNLVSRDYFKLKNYMNREDKNKFKVIKMKVK